MTWTIEPYEDDRQDAIDRARAIAELGGDPDWTGLDDCDDFEDRDTPVIPESVVAWFAAEVDYAAE